jgi:glycosyltransferase involved in cell wall biosynthesis
MDKNKKLIIVSSLPPQESLIIDFICNILQGGLEIVTYRSSNGLWYQKLNSANDPKAVSGRATFSIDRNNPFLSAAFILLLPFLFGYHIWHFRRNYRKEELAGFLMVEANEKIIFSLVARAMGLKVVFFEHSLSGTKNVRGIVGAMLRSSAKNSRIIALTNAIKEKLLENGIKNNVMVVHPGFKIKEPVHQENIFNTLAKKDLAKTGRKFFTIGSIVRLDDRQKVENIFHAVVKCLEIIPNMQVIIAGEGKDRKKLGWVAKSLGIENLVWFVGGEERPKKWLQSFDIAIFPLTVVKFSDYICLVQAMSEGLAIMVPPRLGLEDFIIENKTGTFIDLNDPEMIARQIIRLDQEPELRHYLGANAKELAENEFTLHKASEKIKDIFK